MIVQVANSTKRTDDMLSYLCVEFSLLNEKITRDVIQVKNMILKRGHEEKRFDSLQNDETYARVSLSIVYSP